MPKAAGEAENCADLVRCMYSLTEFEMEALRTLLREGTMGADELAGRLRRDRSTVYRSLQKLVSCQVVRKESRSIARGGYYHVYSAIPKDEIRARLEHCIKDWHSKMRGLLARFDEDIEGL
jgi:predicted transcriptional regulator